jgi:hypothetical protein
MTDTDDVAINRELQALAAELDRVIDGRNPNRGASLDVARKYRALYDRVQAAWGCAPNHMTAEATEMAHRVHLAILDARSRVVRALGTAAWDEPETVEQAKARMGTLPAAPGPGVLDRVNEREPPPLTDEDLDALAGDKLANTGDSMRFYALGGDQLCLWRCGGRAARLGRERSEDEGHRPHCPIYRLVAEVRRLRSDEWLRAAALEIADKYESGTVSRLASAVTILRKHRDGKA